MYLLKEEGFGLELVSNGFTAEYFGNMYLSDEDMMVVCVDADDTIEFVPMPALNRAEVHSMVRGYVARAVENYGHKVKIHVAEEDASMFLSSLRICGIEPVSVSTAPMHLGETSEVTAICLAPKPVPTFMVGMVWNPTQYGQAVRDIHTLDAQCSGKQVSDFINISARDAFDGAED
jgi:hypothetical protein